MVEGGSDPARRQRKQAEADLVEILAIPSVSSLSRHAEDCRRAADWVAGRLRGMGMEVEVVDVVEGGHPVISAEWLGRPGEPALAVYRPFDGQPPDPIHLWQ